MAKQKSQTDYLEVDGVAHVVTSSRDPELIYGMHVHVVTSACGEHRLPKKGAAIVVSKTKCPVCVVCTDGSAA